MKKTFHLSKAHILALSISILCLADISLFADDAKESQAKNDRLQIDEKNKIITKQISELSKVQTNLSNCPRDTSATKIDIPSDKKVAGMPVPHYYQNIECGKYVTGEAKDINVCMPEGLNSNTTEPPSYTMSDGKVEEADGISKKEFERVMENRDKCLEALDKKIAELEATKEKITNTDVAINRGVRDKYNGGGNDEECIVSESMASGETRGVLGMKHANCKSTKTLTQAATISNTVTQMAGSVATQVMGATVNQEATNAGTQGAAMAGAAKMQIMSGGLQAGVGGINLIAGAAQLLKAGSHRKEAERALAAGHDEYDNLNDGEIDAKGDAKISARNADGKTISDTFELGAKYSVTKDCSTVNATDKAACDAARREAIAAKKEMMADDARELSRQAASEQNAAAASASASGMQSLMVGAQLAVQGGFNIAAGKQLEKAAAALNQLPTTQQMIGLDLSTDTTAATTGTMDVITGSGDSAAAVAASPTPDSGVTDLGDPFNTTTPDAPITGPGEVGEHSAYQNPGGGSGGGGGGLGGASSGAAVKDDQAPQTPNLVRESKDGKYGAGQGGYTAGSGSRGGGGGDTNLADLLAKFLPKNGEQDREVAGSILDFGGESDGSRPSPLLDSRTDIFKRIHDNYQRQQKELKF